MTAAKLHRTCLAFALAAAIAAPAGRAAAETYIVKLVGGGEFTSRYQPQESSWDSETVMLLTEHGNWIGVAKSDVTGVTTATENKGYGRVINTTTVSLGLKVNDAPVPGEEGEGQPTSVDLLREYLNRPAPNYSVDQFVEPGEAGQGTSGLPATYGSGSGYNDVILPIGAAGSVAPNS